MRLLRCARDDGVWDRGALQLTTTGGMGKGHDASCPYGCRVLGLPVHRRKVFPLAFTHTTAVDRPAQQRQQQCKDDRQNHQQEPQNIRRHSLARHGLSMRR